MTSKADDPNYHACSHLAELAQIDRALNIDAGDDYYAVSQTLHEITARFMPCDLFFVCLWRPEDGTLRFSYRYDCKSRSKLGDPIVTMLDGGPAAGVIRTGSSLVVSGSEHNPHEAFLTFETMSRPPKSAMHVPIKRSLFEGEDEVFGVLSVQSYGLNAYSNRDLSHFEWLAGKAADSIAWDRYRESHATALRRLSGLESDNRQMSINLVNRFVEIQSELDDAIASLRSQATPGNDELVSALDSLADVSRRIKAKAAFLQFQKSGSEAVANTNFISDDSLTDRERQILPLLASAKSRKEIARSLSISESTLKFHQQNILRKLGLECRSRLIIEHQKIVRAI